MVEFEFNKLKEEYRKTLDFDLQICYYLYSWRYDIETCLPIPIYIKSYQDFEDNFWTVFDKDDFKYEIYKYQNNKELYREYWEKRCREECKKQFNKLKDFVNLMLNEFPILYSDDVS